MTEDALRQILRAGMPPPFYATWDFWIFVVLGIAGTFFSIIAFTRLTPPLPPTNLWGNAKGVRDSEPCRSNVSKLAIIESAIPCCADVPKSVGSADHFQKRLTIYRGMISKRAVPL